MKLTAKAMAALMLNGKTDVIFFDDGMPGFGYRMRVGAGGKVLRSWVVQYRHGGATRRLLLGAGEVLGAEQARTMAKKALGRVANGEDPQASKLDRRGKDKHTLKATVADYLAIKQREVRPRTYTELVRYLTGTYFKPLHSLALDQITRKDVASRLNRISLESSSIVAGRARATLSAFYVWAMQAGIVEANPVIGTAKPKESPSRDRVLSDAELAAIWKACGDDDYGRCIKLLILTGAGGRRLAKLLVGDLISSVACGRCRRAEAKTAAPIRCRCCQPCSPSSRRCRSWRAAISSSAHAPTASPAGRAANRSLISARV